MTAVTSIAKVRSVARRRTEAHEANARTVVFVVAIVGLLAFIGLGATQSASSIVAFQAHGDSLYFFKRQALWILGGGVVAFLTARIQYRWYLKIAFPVFGLALVGLLAVEFLGVTRNGATRWIDVGPIQLQPSEFTKLAVVIALAAAMTKKGRLLEEFGHFIAPVLAILGSVGILLIRQPDLGTAIVVTAAGLAVLMASRAPVRHVLATAGAGSALAAVLAVRVPYRLDRIRGFLDPEAAPLTSGYQVLQSLQALGTGGLFGVGLGESRARWFYLPNAHSDFIFAIIGEELGFAGAGFVLLLFIGLSVLGYAIAMRAADEFGRLLAAGITSWFTIQALVNIAGVTKLLPVTGITLPFVSYGGSSLVVSFAAVGILISIARRGVSGGTR